MNVKHINTIRAQSSHYDVQYFTLLKSMEIVCKSRQIHDWWALECYQVAPCVACDNAVSEKLGLYNNLVEATSGSHAKWNVRD